MSKKRIDAVSSGNARQAEHFDGELFAAQSVGIKQDTAVNGELPKMQMLDKRLLMIDAGYQRTISVARVKDGARDFDWGKFGALAVYLRPNGQYAVVDGQHRLSMANSRNDIKEVPCLVYASKSRALEAKAFVNLNTSAKKVDSLSKWRAAIVAGDKDVIAIDNAIRNAGLLPASGWKVKEKTWCKDKISCIWTLRHLAIVQGFGIDAVSRALETRKKLQDVQLGNDFFRGIVYLISKMSNDDYSSLEKDMIRVSADRITASLRSMRIGGRANTDARGGCSEKMSAYAIISACNFGKHKKRLWEI